MKIKNLIFISIFISTLWSYSQTTYKGKVINQQQKPIAGVSIYTNNKTGTTTNIHGEFEINIHKNKVTVSAIGYETKHVVLTTNFNTITLLEVVENIEEVVVSASRETQKRREVPASISTISSKQIDQTKPIGIEQIINQVPGVFMSTSKASSNEQHFMATRSPISTKSLFLYIEDGLPIRPVAVFNHNALLEMNSTAFNRVEVLKGPASSIYGSEAIGGSFNFLTKNPTKDLEGSIGFQINDLGLKRYQADFSNTFNDKYGLYIGTHYTNREKGPVGHSDYEKFAITLKNVNNISPSLTWTNALTLVDYRSDMSGSISETNYKDEEYKSNQTFTEREALSLRFRSSLNKIWNDKNKTSFNFIYRTNEMNQIPSYRIKQDREFGQLTGTGSGEINSNKFNSFVGLIQHKINFNFLKSSLIVGATVDLSPQDYVAQTIDVTVATESAQNIAYQINENDYILNYQADILNYASYIQYEISPIEKLKLTAALRYDGFSYDYNNKIDDLAGVADTKVTYTNVSPKLGLNYNFSRKIGLFANYSKGFTPPQTSTLFRNSQNNDVGGVVFDLNPSKFYNYEVGGYFSIPSKLKIDLSIYQLDGKDRLISIRSDEGEYVQKNAGETRSIGVELGLKYFLLKNLSLSYSTSFAKHEYLEFYDNNVDYSDTDMPTAPKILSNASLNYKPIPKLSFTLEHEYVGKYNTSFENQAVVDVDINDEDIFGTSTYKGYSIFNFQADFKYKNFNFWIKGLNLLDELYAVRVSYSKWSKENTYSIGNPIAFHFGVNYKF